QQVLGRFSIQDRGLLSRILAEPIEFVDHPSFNEATTAIALFGEAANRAGMPQPWCNAADVDVALLKAPTESITLSAAEEQRLFLQLNYARFRVAEIFTRVGARRLTAGDTAELLMWRARAESARVELVQANMPLVLAMAKRARLGNI